jgi:hypothetical protein
MAQVRRVNEKGKSIEPPAMVGIGDRKKKGKPITSCRLTGFFPLEPELLQALDVMCEYFVTGAGKQALLCR